MAFHITPLAKQCNFDFHVQDCLSSAQFELTRFSPCHDFQNSFIFIETYIGLEILMRINCFIRRSIPYDAVDFWKKRRKRKFCHNAL